MLHDCKEVFLLQHAGKRLPHPAIRTEEHDHRQPSSILSHEVRASVMVGEDVEVVPIQILRHLGVRKHLLLEVLAPVTPDGTDKEEDRFAVPLRGPAPWRSGRTRFRGSVIWSFLPSPTRPLRSAPRSWTASESSATLSDRTSSSSTGQRRGIANYCPIWLPSWSAARSTSSSPLPEFSTPRERRRRPSPSWPRR